MDNKEKSKLKKKLNIIAQKLVSASPSQKAELMLELDEILGIKDDEEDLMEQDDGCTN